MPSSATETSPRVPVHLWVVGILGVLWNCVGAFDYFMTETRNDWYMGQFTPEQLEYFYGFPAWVVAFWAVAVWGGLLGTILLVLRKRVAVPVLLASFLAMLVTFFHNFVLANGGEITGGAGMAFSGLIFLVSLGLWLYARAQARRGVLA